MQTTPSFHCILLYRFSVLIARAIWEYETRRQLHGALITGRTVRRDIGFGDRARSRRVQNEWKALQMGRGICKGRCGWRPCVKAAWRAAAREAGGRLQTGWRRRPSGGPRFPSGRRRSAPVRRRCCRGSRRPTGRFRRADSKWRRQYARDAAPERGGAWRISAPARKESGSCGLRRSTLFIAECGYAIDSIPLRPPAIIMDLSWQAICQLPYDQAQFYNK